MHLQILHLAGWQSCVIVLGIDLVFIASCLGFLYMAEAYGVQRHGRTARHPGNCLSQVCLCCTLNLLKCADHPGAFRLKMDGNARVPPQYYRPYYMMWLYAGTCGLVPFIICISTVFWQQQSWSKICRVRIGHVTSLETCH